MTDKKRVEVMVVGLGGQGALLIGRLLAQAGMPLFKHVLYFPNYGPQMRLGDSECTVILSDEEVSSPVVLYPQAAIVMGPAPLAKFEKRVAPGGIMLLDSSVATAKVERKDIKVYYIPATKAAEGLGARQVTNFVLLGAYLEASKAIPLKALESEMEKRMAGGRGEALLQLNKAALREGARLAASA